MAKLKLAQPPWPNRKKYPFVATVRYKGLVIDVENLAGSTRTGKDANGKTWSTKFKDAHYGEIRKSKGADGDLLDVYIKDPPDAKASKAYIVHQNHPGTHPTKAGKYDEDKVVLGVASVEAAKKLYLRHYNRRDFLRSVTEMDMPSFKKYIFGENKGEKVAMDIQKLAKEIACKTPGEKIKSKGKGRGLARGKGKGPIGIPVGEKEERAKEKEKEDGKKEAYDLGYTIGKKLAAQKAIPAPDIKIPKLGPRPASKPRGESPASAAYTEQAGSPGGKVITPKMQKKQQKVQYYRAGI